MKRYSTFKIIGALSLGIAASAQMLPAMSPAKAALAGTRELIGDNGKPFMRVKKVVAGLNPTKGNTAGGIVTFTEVEGGVRIVADVEGLSPGKHGFHIHEFGDISAPDAASAGGHFNPTKKKHGGPDFLERHVGDLGNIVANEQGYARYDRVDPIIELNGPNSIVGRSVIVHASADDYKTQPAGNSGGRVCCGVISER